MKGKVSAGGFMKQVAVSVVALVAATGAAFASSASVGPLTCWSDAGDIEMQGCVAQHADDGGTFGHCTIITTDGTKKITTRLVGEMRPWGGVHTIRKAKPFLQVKYDRGKFSCRFVPSSEFVVGDCVAGPTSGTCTVVKQSNGSKTYFKASAIARPD